MISDFVHRSGRTARAGSYGKVTSLVQKRDRQLADKIKVRKRKRKQKKKEKKKEGKKKREKKTKRKK